MNGNAFSIMTCDEAFDLAHVLSQDDVHWTYAVEPFDADKHTGARSSITGRARKIQQFFVVEVFDEDGKFIGPL